ncbi:MAG TPA: hypothetical protein PKW99_06030 [Thauera sp.]|nr:hypothetical protein [Thauera sp.]
MLLVALSRVPLGDAHWDAPIYLYQAKRFAETQHLVDIAHNAERIAAQVTGAWPADESYSEAFWRSSRLGHIVVLGVLVETLGSTLAAIEAATWLFALALPLGLFAWCRVALLASRLIEPGSVVMTGLGLSALLYVLSDVYGYLSGNLVSEVVSLGLSGAALWALLASIRGGGAALALLSGLLAFAGYTMRVESVWAWLAFMIAYLPYAGSGQARARTLHRFVLAGGAALLGYLVYAFAFHPLADPRHYLQFAASLSQRSRGGVHAINLVFVVGGLLWVGASLVLRRITVSPVVRFGGLWLFVAGLPSWGVIAAGSEVQTRMLVGLVPPLLLLSAAGWTFALRDPRPRFLRAMLLLGVLLLVVSRPAVYGWLVEQPGLWRIQRLGAAMFVPRYERIDYTPREMAKISEQVFGGDGRPSTLISTPGVAQEYLNLIRFFGPAYPAAARLALAGDPTNPGPCETKVDAAYEPVLFCSGFGDEAALRAALAQRRVLHLRRPQEPTLADAVERYRSDAFVLEEIPMRSDPKPQSEIRRK